MSLSISEVQSPVKKSAILLPWVMVGLGAIYYCYEYFLRISPSVMKQELMHTYHLTGTQYGNLFAFYYHAYVPMQIVVGLLMDRYGPRRLLVLACLFCGLGTYLFVATNNLAMAELGRFLVGFGSAFAFVGAMKIATIWLPPTRFAFIAGLITCLGMIGAMCGDIVLGSLVQKMGWQTLSYISAIGGILLAVVIASVLRDHNPEHEYIHVHQSSFNVLFRGLGQIIKNPRIWINGLIGLLLYLSLSSFAESWGVCYLQEAHGLTLAQSADINSMLFLGWAVGAPFWGWFSDFIQRRCLPLMVASFFGLVFVCILLYVQHLNLITLYTLLFTFGFFCSAQVLIFALCHEMSSAKIAGTAIALTNMIVMIGGNVFQPMIGKILDLSWTGAMVDGARVYSIHGYQIALSVLPISMIIVMILVSFMRETRGEVKQH